VSDEPWETGDPYAARWTEHAYDLIVAGDIKASVVMRKGIETEVISGPCPRCGDQFTHSQVNSAVTGRAGVLADETQGLVSQWVFIDTACQCTGAHPGRPAGSTTGCGIFYRVPAARVSS
jgi:hypothetical protein